MHSGASSLPSPRATAGAVACLLVFGVGGGTLRAAASEGISARVDDRVIQLAARPGQDAWDALRRNDVGLGARDVVIPEGPLHDGDTITVRRARQFTLILDGRTTQQWALADTVGEALRAQLGPTLEGAAVDQPLKLPLFPDPVTVRVTTVKAVTLQVGARAVSLLTTAETVKDLLTRARVTLAGQDMVFPDPSTAITPGMVVHVSRLQPGQKVVNAPIGFRTIRRASALLNVGETMVAESGARGQLTTVYAETRQDGRLVERRQISRSITIPAQPRVILYGTRRPVPTRSAERAPVSVPQGDTVWDRLAQCESTNNWQVNTGNGYYGGLQFDLPTWREYGGADYPHEHSREEQIAVADRLRAARGFAPWPVCGRRLGLI